MREILIERARRQAALKRGGAFQRVELDGALAAIEPPTEDVLALETQIAKVSKTRVERRDPKGLYNKVDRAALAKTGLDDLVEAISLQAEVMDLKANPDRPGEGTVIESKLDRGRGAGPRLHVGGGIRYGSRDGQYIGYDAPSITTPGGAPPLPCRSWPATRWWPCWSFSRRSRRRHRVAQRPKRKNSPGAGPCAQPEGSARWPQRGDCAGP